MAVPSARDGAAPAPGWPPQGGQAEGGARPPSSPPAWPPGSAPVWPPAGGYPHVHPGPPPGPPGYMPQRPVPPGYVPGASYPVPEAPQPTIPARAAWWGLLGFLVAYVLAGIGEAIGEAVTGSSNSGLLDLFSEPGLWAGMLLTVIFVSRRYGTGSLPRDFGLKMRAKDPLWGLAAFATMFVAAEIVIVAFTGTRFAGSNTEILSGQKNNGVTYALVSVMVAVGAPFFEELFFRGFLRTALQARLGPHGAIFAQAAFFGLAHAGEVSGWANVSVVAAMFALGVVLGYTARITGRLAPGMIAHCLFNLVAVISLA